MKSKIAVLVVTLGMLLFLASITSASNAILAVKDAEWKDGERMTVLINRLTNEALREAQTHPCVVEAKRVKSAVWTEVKTTIVFTEDTLVLRLTLRGTNC